MLLISLIYHLKLPTHTCLGLSRSTWENDDSQRTSSMLDRAWKRMTRLHLWERRPIQRTMVVGGRDILFGRKASPQLEDYMKVTKWNSQTKLYYPWESDANQVPLRLEMHRTQFPQQRLLPSSGSCIQHGSAVGSSGAVLQDFSA